MRLLYTKRIAGLPEGFSIRNPDYFLKPENGVEHVTIEGKYPVIAEAYEQEGVSVEMAGEGEKRTAGVFDPVTNTFSKEETFDEPETKALDDMSVDELKAHLGERGVEFSAKATKSQLLELAKGV